jgi:hypothetical protein
MGLAETPGGHPMTAPAFRLDGVESAEGAIA